MQSEDDTQVIKFKMARSLPSMLRVAGYAVIVGLAFTAHLMPLYIAYAGLALLAVAWFGFLNIQSAAVQYYNELALFTVIKELEDGTLLGDLGLSKKEVDKDE